MTIEEKLVETQKLENKANIIRDEINRLQNKKKEMYWQHQDTGQIDQRLEDLKEDLMQVSSAFEVSLSEIGENEYYSFLKSSKGEKENDRHKIN